VHGRVREREQAEQAAQRDRPAPPGEDPERREREAREEQAQRPVAERVGDEVDRVRAEVLGQEAADEIPDGRQAREPDARLEDDATAAAQ